MASRIYFDDIIYSLQSNGGISNFWTEITSRVISSNRFSVTRSSSRKLKRYFPVPVDTDIFHSSYYRLPANSKTKTVLTVHDFIYELGFIKKWNSFVNIHQVRAAIHQANVIVCVSENTKADLLKIYPKIVRDSDIHVIPHSSVLIYKPELNDQKPTKLSFVDDAIKKKYILFVGKRGYYKNFKTAVQGFLASGLPKSGFKMFCVGSRFNNDELFFLETNNLESTIICISNANDDELTYLYQNAFVLLYPSLYEGFGLPPLEAMTCGCPVITSNTSSLPEVVSDAGITVDPLDVSAISSGLKSIQSNDYRNYLIKSGFARAKLFSWDLASKKYIEIYKSL